MDWANGAVNGIIKQINFRTNLSGCFKCKIFDICAENNLWCTNAIEGILKDTHWKPTYKQGE